MDSTLRMTRPELASLRDRAFALKKDLESLTDELSTFTDEEDDDNKLVSGFREAFLRLEDVCNNFSADSDHIEIIESSDAKASLAAKLNDLGIEVVAGKVRRSDIKEALAKVSVVASTFDALKQRIEKEMRGNFESDSRLFRAVDKFILEQLRLGNRAEAKRASDVLLGLLVGESDETTDEEFDEYARDLGYDAGVEDEEEEEEEDQYGDTLPQILGNLAAEIDMTPRADYSGRGMFGDQCYAITVSRDDYDLAFDILKKRVPGTRSDNMGLGMIIYWPNVPYEKIKNDLPSELQVS